MSECVDYWFKCVLRRTLASTGSFRFAQLPWRMLLLSDITLREGWLCNLSLLHFTHSLSFIRLLVDTYFEVPSSRPTSILQKLFLETAVLYVLFFISVRAVESKLFIVRISDKTELGGNAAGVMRRRLLLLQRCCSILE